MDSTSYQALCLRTVPPSLQFWHADADARAREQLFCNCALGLSGEASEIEDAPTSDEIGDGYWYSYVLFRVLDAPPRLPTATADPNPLRIAYHAAGALCELAKKTMFHGRQLEVVQPTAVGHLHRYIDALAALDPQPPQATFEQNIAKLTARYPAGFFERG